MSEELERLQTEGHIEKLSSCSDEYFISPIVITVKKDQSIKLALDFKVLNKEIHKNKYQMANIEMLIDTISQHLTDTQNGQQAYFTTIDLKYAYCQLKLHQDTAKHCNFNIICGQSTGTYRFKTGFYGLTDMPAEFQKAMDYTLIGLQNSYCFLDDIIIVSTGTEADHLAYFFKCLKKLDDDNLRINLQKCHFAKTEIEWLGYKFKQTEISPLESKTAAILTIPPPTTLEDIHSTHPGSFVMLSLAQNIWWPYIHRDILVTSECKACTEIGKNLKSVIPHRKWTPLPKCSEPNDEIQIDFGGPILNEKGIEQYFIISIDRYSKYLTVEIVNNTSGQNVIKFLNNYIYHHGVPRTVKLDPARCFTGKKFETFCTENNITPIYAPAKDHRAIGHVEPIIQTIKR